MICNINKDYISVGFTVELKDYVIFKFIVKSILVVGFFAIQLFFGYLLSKSTVDKSFEVTKSEYKIEVNSLVEFSVLDTMKKK